MTVLVGVLCRDGVVIGADTSATSVQGQLRTVEQPTHKIEIVAGRTIVAHSGSVGLAQRFTALVQKASDGRLFSNEKSPIEIGKTLCRMSLDDFQQTGVGVPVNFGALVAFSAESRLNLCELEMGTLQPELKSAKGLLYVSMGSGQMICDPFLGLQRRIFWKDGEPPRLSEGVFATVWTLQHAVDVNPGGIKEPIEVAVLERIKGSVVARQLDSDDLSEHLNNIEDLEQYISQYPSQKGRADVEVPKVKRPNDPG